MSFDSFANTLILAYIRHDWMRDEITAAGIRIDQLPRQVLGKPILESYLEKAKTKSHDTILFEMERDLTLLERFSDSLTVIPKNPEVLRDKFQELSSAFQFQQLADELRLNPDKGKELIKRFTINEARGVEYQTLSELSLNVDRHHAQSKEGKSVLVVKGFEKLSAMIGGFNPERLGIFLGGTGFGKTNFAVNLALQAGQTMGVAYANMEMGYDDMVRRFAVIASAVSYSDYSRGKFHVDDVKSSLQKNGQNIFLTSGKTLTFDQITAWARLLASKNNIGMLIVDYDQKVDLNLKHQAEEWKALQKLIEAFEDLSKELGIYCLVLAQVNREGLISGSHRAQFPAHTVLAFHEHEAHGPIIEAKKNRHGKKAQALTVLYNEQNSVITECEIITLQPKKEERHKINPMKKGDPWWNK
jgi:KaiC/GvpD/RAD55 family RecA-like ATPase